MIVQFALKCMKVISKINRATVQDKNFRVFLLFPGVFEKRPKRFGIVKWPQSLTGCLRPTPADNLSILAGIQPAGFRLKRATLSPARHAIGPGNQLHPALISSQGGNAWHLKSKHPIVPAAQLISSSDENNRSGALWADHRCNK